MARDNCQKIVSKVVAGMADWNMDVRAKSTQILTSFLKYTEDQATGYINIIMPAICKILCGDDLPVMQNVTICGLISRQ